MQTANLYGQETVNGRPNVNHSDSTILVYIPLIANNYFRKKCNSMVQLSNH